MNYYSSLIYIAFFKGRFFDYPGYVRTCLCLSVCFPRSAYADL